MDRALSDFDLRHRLVVSYFYNLPFGGQGRWWKDRFLGSLLGGWRLGGIVSTRNGTPINLRISVRKEGYLFAPNRPSIVPGRSNNPIEGETAGCDGVAAGRKVGTPDYYLDPCSFRVPSPGTLGNNGRNTVSGPKVFSMDLSLQREFPVNGKSRMQFRAELFNLTNHTNLRPFSANSAVVFSGASGRVNGAVGNFTNTVTTSRQMQFALRLSF